MKKISYILAFISLCIFIIISTNFKKPLFLKLDEAISDLFYGNKMIIAFHYLGSTSLIVAVALILLVILWFKQRNYRGMLFVLLTIAGGRVLNQIIKNVVERPRPEIADQITSFSFPSGHAMLSLLYLFTIAYLLAEVIVSKKKMIIVWLIAAMLSMLIGLSRIAESHHYPTDVIAGWTIAYSWFVLCAFWYEQRKTKFNKIKNNT
ncbi:undecaprenyl-diphosphatase [Ureibacillus xyleni]|uniref:Undecaprenyl-diphosphatase n=1 Tax=Ureibacillus xyleni TaxID=614648 RepID=A0A285TEJ6_9BACL|nr:phosphatase PAP2 family protein [Ureibacillus xyleni]SOC18401.1 undecaprenyl-diphosphatase [Ureibacillus xyleni]